jgi:palmitoyltransferase
VFPRQFLGPDSSVLLAVLGAAWCIYVVVCFSFHYYMAMTVSPGSPFDVRSWSESLPPLPKTLSRWTPVPHISAPEDTVERKPVESTRHVGRTKTCKKCPGQPPKPERAHHCRACQRCWLKFDHQSVALSFPLSSDGQLIPNYLAAHVYHTISVVMKLLTNWKSYKG